MTNDGKSVMPSVVRNAPTFVLQNPYMVRSWAEQGIGVREEPLEWAEAAGRVVGEGPETMEAVQFGAPPDEDEDEDGGSDDEDAPSPPADLAELLGDLGEVLGDVGQGARGEGGGSGSEEDGSAYEMRDIGDESEEEAEGEEQGGFRGAGEGAMADLDDEDFGWSDGDE